MSYDASKLTNLGQMKSALQAVKTRIDATTVSRSTATIAVADWESYDSIFRTSSIITPQNHHYYDIHLSTDTSNSTSIMCANADIRAKAESNGIYLYCYGTKPTQSFTVEIIDTPIAENVIGLTYDIGDDFLVYPSITDALDTRITAVEGGLTSTQASLGSINDTASTSGTTAWSRIKGAEGSVSTLNTTVSTLESSVEKLMLCAANVSIATTKWTSSGDTSYPYKAVLTMTDVTADYFPIVQFADSDARTYDFSPKVTPGAGTITVFCKTAPSTSVTVSSIFCWKGSTRTVS